METDSRPDSPQSSSSSQSDLSSPSFNRDSEFDFAAKTKDFIEAPTNRDNILAMAPVGGGSFENESDTNSTATTKTIQMSPNLLKDNSSSGSTDSIEKRRVPKPVSCSLNTTLSW